MKKSRMTATVFRKVDITVSSFFIRFLIWLATWYPLVLFSESRKPIRTGKEVGSVLTSWNLVLLHFGSLSLLSQSVTSLKDTESILMLFKCE